MIPLQRPPLPEELVERMSARGERLPQYRGGARELWRDSRTIRRELSAHLVAMAAGLSRCMYCGDSEGTSIDHFQPIAMAPQRAFDWLNHLWACAYCNSNQKRDLYPMDRDGLALLIDPTADEPADHLDLVLATGAYRPRTAKGSETIRIFGLDRPVLERGRAQAYVRCRSMLRDLARLAEHAERAEAGAVAHALTVQPFADVLYEMLRLRTAPRAALVFGAETVAGLNMLKDPRALRGPLHN
ncbi:HNH endonuclease [Kitasatospora sp. NBC_01287]|uniref:HNH endonuclease n=1 Tax=Kitasatospora sp. NBC_01287 TaxID=2903573 RepID=UPI0022535DCA|nr:HNH endonuclease [Kitasatospora sp. NBC_01287]MCX4747012.1 HNH endonuclease [Kitasatospora sp. NBC_01287]